MWTSEPALIAALAVFASLALSSIQSAIASRAGSDHPVHAFLRDGIRANGFRLFITVPRLLNKAHCVALPLYLHWILARLPLAAIAWSERLLNPLLNAVHVLLLAIVAGEALAIGSAASGIHAGHAALLFALTPQLYHALSARNFGLSARGAGLVLLTAFFAAAQMASASPHPAAWWLVLAVLGWLVWGFSTFAQQALVLLSLLLLFAGLWRPAAGAALGLALFLAVHPAYAWSYVRHTLRFQSAYARELAPIYVLQRRPSVWRDLVWDIWRKPSEVGLKRAVMYAYENPAIVVVLLNPLVIFSAGHLLSGAGTRQDDWVAFAGAVATAGLVAMLLTSARPTRFLGEPERYVEVVTPWACLYAASAAAELAGVALVWSMIASFGLINLAQLCASWMLMRHVTVANEEIDEVARVIDATGGPDIRFCCNNEQVTKMLMGRPWRFAYFIAVGQDYAGMTATEAFSRFPNLRPEACERVARAYRINWLLLDLKVFDRVFDTPPPDLQSMQSLYRTDRFALLRLQWHENVAAPLGVS